MKNNTKTKRIALAVHVNQGMRRVSKIYSWILPESIQGLRAGDIIEVENLCETDEVVFIAEKVVSADDCKGSKKAIKVVEKTLKKFTEEDEWNSKEWNSEEIAEFQTRIEVLAKGINELDFNHEEFFGGLLDEEWFELDPIFEKIEEVLGCKRSTKRIALCVYIDTQYLGQVSSFKEYILPEEIKHLQTGQILTLDSCNEEEGELVFIAEQIKKNCKTYRHRIAGVSNKKLKEISKPYNYREILTTLMLLAEGIKSGLRATKDFSGYDLEYGWWSWDKEKNIKTREEIASDRREKLKERRMQEKRNRLSEQKANKERLANAIQILKQNTIKLEELEYGNLYLMVQEDFEILGRCPLGLSVDIFMLTENSRWELSPRFMLRDYLRLNDDYKYGRESYKMFRLNREKEEGYHKNAPSIRQLHTDSTVYLDFAGFAERCEKTIEVRYGLGNSYKCPADTKDFATFGMLAHGGIERGQTELEFEVLNLKVRFNPMELSTTDMNVLSPEKGIGFYQICSSKQFSDAVLKEITQHLKDDGKCYTCQILKDGGWQTLGTTGKVVGAGYVKPYIFNASKNPTEFFDGKSYRIGRYNCGSGIRFSKYYDETRIGYCPGEMAEW